MYTNEIFSEELYTSIYNELLGECKTKYGFSEQIAGGKDTSVATTAIIGYCLHRIGILKESAQEEDHKQSS